MQALLALGLALAQAEQEGKRVVIGMLIVGLVFISVIALGQLSRWARHRKR